MGFKNQHKGSSMPEVNLVPMMDVLMSVLTFFIITSMTLTSQKLGNISLPGAEAGVSEQKAPKQLVVGLNKQDQLILENKKVTSVELALKMRSFLTENPEGAVVLKADRELPYQEVMEVLQEMGNIGGDRVSLSINKN
ncbi:biopolymer transporter ExbD [Lyngbya aestuarii]|uniref:biopolymer transporter ExbD n=1 Tax=Lyngbya aestuarii TaxID=118322 RepID=UPI00403E0F71